MNIKRGLFRLWTLCSALWCLSFLGFATPDWYHAASYWYRSRGIEVNKCKPWELKWQPAAIPEKKQQSSANGMSDLPPGYTIRGQGGGTGLPPGLVLDKPAAPTPKTTFQSLGLIPPDNDVPAPAPGPGGPGDNSFAKYATPPDGPWSAYQPDCFHVTALNGAKYLVDVAKGSPWRNEQVRDVVLYNPGLFPRVDNENAQTQPRVDLTHGDPRPGMNGYIIDGNVYDHPDLRFTVELTIAAFLVPFALLVLGQAVWWVAMGFKT
ncbi:MAG TPA: hypothetical protein VHW90_08800 [Stellaceae bacterium]|nr:hypothetical protein [Stellaceae bacterium]